MFIDLVKAALTDSVTPELALEILKESKDMANATELFKAASALRDERLGRDLWLSAGISAVLPCRVVPRCAYCTYFATEGFPVAAIVKAANVIEGLGIRHVHLSGGTDLNGYDNEIIAMVSAIRATSRIGIEINLGPSLNTETIRVLKGLGVTSVTSSLETFDPGLFKKVKPGDSLDKRKRLIEDCDREGMPVRSMMMIGLGETHEDRINQLFYLKGIKSLYHLRFSRFFPYKGTVLRNNPRCSPWELARTVAVARLILPDVQLGLAAGNTSDDIPLWFLAGGGNQLMGASVSRKKAMPEPGEEAIPVTDEITVVSMIKALQRLVEGFDRQVVFDCPEK